MVHSGLFGSSADRVNHASIAAREGPFIVSRKSQEGAPL